MTLSRNVLKEANNLASWLRDQGNFIDQERLEIRESQFGGLGLFLKNDSSIPETNILLLEISYQFFFHPYSIFLSDTTKELLSLVNSDRIYDSYENLLYFAIVLEMRNESSFFKPYFNSISPLRNFGILLPEREIAVLKSVPNRHDIVKRIRDAQTIYRIHLEEVNRVLSEYDNDIKEISEKEYFYACNLANSRSFGQPGWMIGSPEEYQTRNNLPVLIPFFDLVNHHSADIATNNYHYHPERSSNVKYYNFRWSISPNSYIADRELFNAYHPPSIDQTINFIYYGFVQPANLSADLNSLLHYIGRDPSDQFLKRTIQRDEERYITAILDYNHLIGATSTLMRIYLDEMFKVVRHINTVVFDDDDKKEL